MINYCQYLDYSKDRAFKQLQLIIKKIIMLLSFLKEKGVINIFPNILKKFNTLFNVFTIDIKHSLCIKFPILMIFYIMIFFVLS